MRSITFVITVLILSVLLSNLQSNTTSAQPRITNTPISVVIPTTAPTATPQPQNNVVVEVSPSPTFTPTAPLPDARLVSVAASGTALIRDFPENGAVIGVLADNTEYQVLGQYFSWYQIRLDSNPSGSAWVYFEDIQVSGNLQEIPQINPDTQPAAASAEENATATVLALFQTPGVIETLTAEARFIEVEGDATNQVQATSEILPTYTPPADIVPLQATSLPNAQITPIQQGDLLENTIASVSEGNIPPILPIIVLALFGTLGLIISSFRR